MAQIGGCLMGKLVERLRLECEHCKMKALPNTIRGRYADNQPVVIYECPMCGYFRHHHSMGHKGHARAIDARRKRKPFTYGRLTERLTSVTQPAH